MYLVCYVMVVFYSIHLEKVPVLVRLFLIFLSCVTYSASNDEHSFGLELEMGGSYRREQGTVAGYRIEGELSLLSFSALAFFDKVGGVELMRNMIVIIRRNH